jgi:hypothetical protein
MITLDEIGHAEAHLDDLDDGQTTSIVQVRGFRKKSPKRATACHQALNGIFRSANRGADGTVRINRFGRSILPQCPWLIYRDVVSCDR